MIKTLNKLREELSQFDKEHLQNLIANIILIVETLEAFPLRSGTSKNVPQTTTFQHHIGSPS